MKSLLIMAFSILLVSISQETAFGKLNIGYNSRYDSTYGFVKYDSTTQWGKARIFSGENVKRLINQELILKKQKGNSPYTLDLRNRKSKLEKNDVSTIYKCCDTNEFGNKSKKYDTDYEQVQNFKFKVVDVEPSKYYQCWHTGQYNIDENPDSETYILTLKPSNEDTILYYWFQPYYAHIGEFELNGFIEKNKRKYLGKKFVLSWIPYEYSEKGLNIMDKWECININYNSSDYFQNATLKNSKGDTLDLRLYEYFIPELKKTIYTEEKADYFLKKYKKKLWEATLNRELQLGMPSELVLEIWRTPDNISKKMTKAKTTQKWEYSDGSYLVFENDKLTEVFNTDD
jgi:hypothetical protein